MSVRVILLEDDDDFREMVAAMLRARGYDVMAVSTPLDCHINNDPGAVCADILITDYFMPGMNGLDFLERVTMSGTMIPISNRAVMSASLPDHEVDRLRSLGCMFFQKPFAEAELHRWLEACEARVDSSRHLSWLEDSSESDAGT